TSSSQQLHSFPTRRSSDLLEPEKAGLFYEVHKERPFYKDLVRYMSSGPIVAVILEKENAVEEFRKLIGATDPSKAAPGTIRNLRSEEHTSELQSLRHLVCR